MAQKIFVRLEKKEDELESSCLELSKIIYLVIQEV